MDKTGEMDKENSEHYLCNIFLHKYLEATKTTLMIAGILRKLQLYYNLKGKKDPSEEIDVQTFQEETLPEERSALTNDLITLRVVSADLDMTSLVSMYEEYKRLCNIYGSIISSCCKRSQIEV